MQGDPKYRIEQHWSVGLGATLGGNRIFFSSKRDFFREKSIVPSLSLGFECTINPQNSVKMLCELLLILRVDRKRKKKSSKYIQGDLDVKYERDWSASLGATLGDGQKIKNNFFSSRDFFQEKPIVSCCWASNVL